MREAEALKKRIAALIAAAAAVLLLFGAYRFLVRAPEARRGEKAVTVRVIAEKRGVDRSFSYKTERAYLSELLEDEKQDLKPEMKDGQYGKFVTGMLGVEADSSKEFFCLKVDGKDAAKGVSGLPLENGKTYTLTLTPL